MCDCKSYNNDSGETPNVVLNPPDSFGFTYGSGEKKTEVCIDACIAPVIQHLWNNNIVTLNSCCGHGKLKPSIILEDEADNREARKIRAIINQVDPREFVLLSWKLTEI